MVISQLLQWRQLLQFIFLDVLGICVTHVNEKDVI